MTSNLCLSYPKALLIDVTKLIIINIIAVQENNNTETVYLSFLSQPIHYQFGRLFIQVGKA